MLFFSFFDKIFKNIVHFVLSNIFHLSKKGTLHPKRRGEHAASLGRAIIVHFTFGRQEAGLLANTTLLDRYRELAEGIMADNAAKFYNGKVQPRAHLAQTRNCKGIGLCADESTDYWIRTGGFFVPSEMGSWEL